MHFIIVSLFCLMVVTKAQADNLLLGFILDVSGELTPQQCLDAIENGKPIPVTQSYWPIYFYGGSFFKIGGVIDNESGQLALECAKYQFDTATKF